MNKFELWRQRRRQQSEGAAEAPPPVEALRAEREALAAEAGAKRAGAEKEAAQEDTVPAAFYRNIGAG